jgi:hypothetical protein
VRQAFDRIRRVAPWEREWTGTEWRTRVPLYAPLDELISRIPEERKVEYLTALLKHTLESKNYDKQRLLLEYLKTHLDKKESNILRNFILVEKHNFIQRPILEYLGLPHVSITESKSNLEKKLKNKSKDSLSLNLPRGKLQSYLDTEGFVRSALSALFDNDMKQLDYVFSHLPMDNIELYIQALVDKAIENNRKEKELAIYLSRFLDRVSSTSQNGLSSEQIDLLRNLALNLKAKDPTSIVNPNLQRLVRHISAKNKTQHLKNEQTRRNAPYQKLKNNTIARLQKQKAPQWIINDYKKASLNYYKSGWAGNVRTRRRRRN